MAHIRTQVMIHAAPDAVWEVVHERIDEAPRWAGYLRQAVQVSPGPPGPGTRVRYDLNLPGDYRLLLENDTWEPPRRCAGRFVDGPVRGDWSYLYTGRGGTTQLTYEMDYEMTGMLRFAGGLLRGRYEEGIREAMHSLRDYVEKGGG